MLEEMVEPSAIAGEGPERATAVGLTWVPVPVITPRHRHADAAFERGLVGAVDRKEHLAKPPCRLQYLSLKRVGGVGHTWRRRGWVSNRVVEV